MAPSCNPPPLLVLGASARAFAASAAKAGVAVHAADLFCDLDLVECCRSTLRVTRYPEELVDVSDRFGAAAWCYTGGLENHPDIIEAISRRRSMLGASPDAVRRVRDPSWLARACRRAGLVMPPTFFSADGVPTDGTYLVKPLRSAGGHGIHRWTGEHSGPRAPKEPLWQLAIEGQPLSAAFVAARGVSRLLFATRQLVGWTPCRAGRFAWCGAVETSTGPEVESGLRRLGDVLAEDAELVGLFGVDFVRSSDGSIAVLEVNPRPTASMELLERSGRCSPAAVHLASFGHHTPNDATCIGMPSPPKFRRLTGKAVLHAVEPGVASPVAIDSLLDLRRAWADETGFPAVADIPFPGSIVRRGAPLLTVFVSGEDEASVLRSLEERLSRAEQVMLSSPPCDEPRERRRPDRRAP